MGRPRKRKLKPAGQQPTDADVKFFTKEGEGPGGTNIFGFHCYDCDHYEQMIGGRQQSLAINKKGLTHQCNKETDSWNSRKDLQ